MTDLTKKIANWYEKQRGVIDLYTVLKAMDDYIRELRQLAEANREEIERLKECHDDNPYLLDKKEIERREKFLRDK